ncbi:hypothetical protein [Alloyangia pacifica]|uniref:Uncharacterized protein n=1 Tax=Alloyangia pacifica TaxID=311180 RepID=A0A1I6PNM3_9RHOB|nr:hypothetical protein [Alloyangia pacifica]SDG32274.1 hypothetical protein SAMN04488245_102366 [Alloyangia pacifica]SFS41827.1 hypothetical protein SAMN04488050_101667 [Alloyangia pacifica]
MSYVTKKELEAQGNVLMGAVTEVFKRERRHTDELLDKVQRQIDAQNVITGAARMILDANVKALHEATSACIERKAKCLSGTAPDWLGEMRL